MAKPQDHVKYLYQLAGLLGVSTKTIYRWGDRIREVAVDPQGFNVERVRTLLWEEDGRRSREQALGLEHQLGPIGTAQPGRKAREFGGQVAKGLPGPAAPRTPQEGSRAAHKNDSSNGSPNGSPNGAGDGGEEQLELPLELEADAELLEQTIRYRRAKADEAEVKLAKLRGDLIEREEVERAIESRVMELRTTLASLPPRIARRLSGLDERQIVQELSDIFQALLQAFSRADEVFPDGLPFRLPAKRRGRKKRTKQGP